MQIIFYFQKSRLSKLPSTPDTPKLTPKSVKSSAKESTAATPESSKSTPSNKSKKELQFDVKKEIKSEPVTPNKEDTFDEPQNWTHTKIDFIKPDQIRDSKGRRPNHPEYDPRTLFVPESFLKQQTPGHRQWWDLKSQHYDCILFFKVGKFYELYHMDATVGVKELGFTYMRGEYAHSGFPEQAYDKMATMLVERGYKVARVEQTENPDMMSERVKKMKNATKFDRVVKREICQITNKGTQVFGQQVNLTLKHEANYMMAVVEKSTNKGSRYGICYADTSIGDFYVGEFDDDLQCSRFLTLLAHNPPVLILTERGGLSSRTSPIIKARLSGAIREVLAPKTEMWMADKTLKTISEKYFNGVWPKVIKIMQDDCK